MTPPSPQMKKLKVSNNLTPSVNPKPGNLARKEQLTTELEKILMAAVEAAAMLEKILPTKEQTMAVLEKIPTATIPSIIPVSAVLARGTAGIAVNDGGSGDALGMDGPFLPHSSGLDDTTHIHYHYRVGPRKH